MKWKNYYRSLNAKDREQYASRAGTTREYIEIHLIPGRKIPRAILMQRLVDASNGDCSMVDLLKHFYEENTAA